MAQDPSYTNPSILIYNGTTGPLPNFYSDPLTYTLNDNLPNGEPFFNPFPTSNGSGQFYRGEGASLIPPISGIGSDPLYTNSTVCSNMFGNMTPLWSGTGTVANGMYYPTLVQVQIGGNAASQSMYCCSNWKATVAGGNTTWAIGSYGYCSAGNFSNLEAYLLDENVNYNPAYAMTPGGPGASGQIEGTGISYGTAQQCMGCHGHMNVQASDGPAYLLSGHKNALRKVIPGVPLADASGTPYSGIDGAYYILGGWLESSPVTFPAAPVGLSVGACARCHTTGWSPNPPNTATGTSGVGGYGSQLLTQSGLEPSITTINSGTVAFNGTVVNGINGYRNSTGVPTYNYAALPSGTLNTSPYSEFGPAGAVSASWYLNGVTCERCHYSNIGTSVSSQGIEAVSGRSGLTYYEGTGSYRYGKDMAATVPSGTNSASNPEIVPYVANGTLAANGYSFEPLATGMNSLLLCMQCHRSETVTSIGANTANIAINWPVVVASDSGSCADGSGAPYATCIANGSTWNFVPTIHEQQGTELLASPHAKYIGPAPQMNQQNSADLSFANGTLNNPSNFLTINQSSSLPGTKGCTGCHDPHFTTANVPNVPTNPSWGVLYSDNGMTTTSSPSGPQGEMPALVSAGANSHNCNDAACHGGSMQQIAHPTGPGTPFPTGTSADFPGACFTCHMQGASGVSQTHFFKINPNASYFTYPTAAQFYAGQTALNPDPTATVLYNGVTLANGTYTYGTLTSYGTPSAAMINGTATWSTAVANDVDVACGQCHGGGTVPNQNPYGIVPPSPAPPWFNRTYLASGATGIHGSSTALTPVLSLPSGTYNSAQSVSISDATSGATICYTAGATGTTPVVSSTGTCTTGTAYTAPIPVTASETIEAVAGGTGYTSSNVVSATYTINVKALVPTFSETGGTYYSPQTVTVSEGTSGATTCYTTDGSKPALGATSGSCTGTGTAFVSPATSSPIPVLHPTTIKAIAGGPGFKSSDVASHTFTVKALAPTFSPSGGSFNGTQTVTVTDNVKSPTATIYWAVGAAPTSAGIGTTTTSCSSPCSVTVSTSETLEAVAAYDTGLLSESSVKSAVYYITASAPAPTFSPVAGTYTTAQTVTLADTATGVTICYTTNGTAPAVGTNGSCLAGAQYSSSSPIPVSTSMTIKAVAGGNGYGSSSVASAVYTINIAPAPTFSPVAGSYAAAQTVTLADNAGGVTICYTTNGTTTPVVNANTGTCTAGTTYSSPITVSTSETIEAVAGGNGYASSSVASAAYIISGAPAPTPTFSPGAGTYPGPVSVTLNDTGVGVTICYTTNGTTPAVSTAGVCTTGTTYTYSPISVSSSETIEAVAGGGGYGGSAVASASYTIQ